MATTPAPAYSPANVRSGKGSGSTDPRPEPTAPGRGLMVVEASVKLKMISADTHVVEPADLWVSRLPERFRSRAPHIESRPDGDYKITEGSPERRISGAEGGMAITKGAG